MRRFRFLMVPLLALALVAPACGDDDDETGTTGEETSEDGGLAGRLPEEIRDRGSLIVGSDIAYAPMESFKEGTQEAEGVDVDLCNAIAAEFGPDYECEFRNAVFDTLISGLGAGRFDLIMSSMTDNKERQAEVDFVDYFLAGSAILAKKGNPEGIESLDDLCGKTVAVQRGTTNEEILTEQKGKCELSVLPFDTDPEAQQQVKLGRAVADVSDFPIALYAAKVSGGGNDFEVVAGPFPSEPYGIAVSKDETELRDAIQAALRSVIDDGTYDEILEKWGVEQGALRSAAVNGGS